jgi:hypothetical protein
MHDRLFSVVNEYPWLATVDHRVQHQLACVEMSDLPSTMKTDREQRLLELKVRIDAVHEVILHALRVHDEEAIDRAMQQQHWLMTEYSALLRDPQKRLEDDTSPATDSQNPL